MGRGQVGRRNQKQMKNQAERAARERRRSKLTPALIIFTTLCCMIRFTCLQVTFTAAVLGMMWDYMQSSSEWWSNQDKDEPEYISHLKIHHMVKSLCTPNQSHTRILTEDPFPELVPICYCNIITFLGRFCPPDFGVLLWGSAHPVKRALVRSATNVGERRPGT